MVSNYDQMRPLGQQDPDPPSKLIFPEITFLETTLPVRPWWAYFVRVARLRELGLLSLLGPVMLSH